MSFNIREKFKERKFSFKIKKKKKMKKEKDINNVNPIKIIIFSPLMFMGLFYNLFNRSGNNKKVESTHDNYHMLDDKNEVKNKENASYTLFNKVASNNQIIDNKQRNTSKFSFVYKEKEDKNKSISKKENTHLYTYENKSSIAIEKKIFSKFKEKLEDIKNEIDIIESEEYLISKYSDDKNILEEAITIRKQIETLLRRLDIINEQYNLFKENNLIEDPLLLDDSFLIDDIIKYREKISKEEYKNIPNSIKLLEEYKYLYIKTDEIEEKIASLKELTNVRIYELSERDKKYDKARKQLVNLNDVNKCCETIINRYNKYLEDLYQKIDKIDEKKYIEYKLKGMNGLLSSSLRYISLLTLTPLRGLIPGIAARTLATRKLVSNIIGNIHYEKIEKTKYLLMDYESEINKKIYDIDDIEYNIDSALDDISRLKEEFRNYFLKYNLKEYEVVYKKINKLENNMQNNKSKINIIRKALIKNKKLNKTALIKVKKLNS